MRILLLILLPALIQMQLTAQSKVPFEQTCSDYGFKGKVKTAKTEVFRNDGTLDSRMEYEFDSLGRLTKRRDYDRKEKLKRAITNSYGKNGRLLVCTDRDFGGRKEYRKDSLVYDSLTNITEQWTLDSLGQITFLQISTYDKKGNRITLAYYKTNHVPVYSSRFSYDKSGNCIQTINYDENGKISGWYISEYNQFNSTTRFTIYNPDSSAFVTTQYSYNEKHLCIEERTAYSDPGKNEKWIYTYDSLNRKTGTTRYNSNGETVTNYSWQFDPSGNISESTEFTYLGTRRFSYQCIYDSKQNWTSRKTFMVSSGRLTLSQTEKNIIVYY